MKAYIHKDDLEFCIAKTNANTSVKSFSKSAKTDWVEIDLDRDAYLLCTEHTPSVPFSHQGNWFTIADYDASKKTLSTELVRFRNLHVTSAAFCAAIQVFRETVEMKKLKLNIAQVEQEIQRLYAEGKYFEITELVCEWGGTTGNRVLGNLKNRIEQDEGTSNDRWPASAKKTFKQELKEWLDFAHQAKLPDQVDEVLRQGIKIKGLGVSYASKHLRLLLPKYFPVLDSLLCERFGFATNPSGYELFLEHLNLFKNTRPEFSNFTVGEIEAGIFKLIRNGLPPLFEQTGMGAG